MKKELRHKLLLTMDYQERRIKPWKKKKSKPILEVGYFPKEALKYFGLLKDEKDTKKLEQQEEKGDEEIIELDGEWNRFIKDVIEN